MKTNARQGKNTLSSVKGGKAILLRVERASRELENNDCPNAKRVLNENRRASTERVGGTCIYSTNHRFFALFLSISKASHIIQNG